MENSISKKTREVVSSLHGVSLAFQDDKGTKQQGINLWIGMDKMGQCEGKMPLCKGFNGTTLEEQYKQGRLGWLYQSSPP